MPAPSTLALFALAANALIASVAAKRFNGLNRYALGAVAEKLGRRYLLIDESPEAVRVMRERLGD